MTTALSTIRGSLDRISAMLRADRSGSAGLIDGFGGSALFHAYNYRLGGDDRELDALHDVVTRCARSVADPAVPLSHCSGVAGIAWCLRHLMAQGFIEPDDDVFADIDPIVFAHAARPGDDFLHDGLGAVLYAIDRFPDSRAVACVGTALAHLTAIADGPLNLGLAHGAAAMISLAAKATASELLAPRARALITRLVERIVAASNPAGVRSMFPRQIDATNQPMGSPSSRLGWCNGDLGIALALDHAGYTQLAGEIFSHVALHRDPDNGEIRDASLCHGSMGVAHAFRRIGNSRCADAWLDRAMVDADAGFPFHMQSGPVVCTNMLQGVAGIGLALIASIDDAEPAWDRCLLMS
jgi:hypothetical protein